MRQDLTGSHFILRMTRHDSLYIVLPVLQGRVVCVQDDVTGGASVCGGTGAGMPPIPDLKGHWIELLLSLDHLTPTMPQTKTPPHQPQSFHMSTC
ncbi:hypothetical protein E2C01_018254 [Portunus trituberculatus]|uniref:Uncharacterized protein n=1 Tax=Portunus trituberculatus TaxID=210409 RepID=A0A5B7DU19_PORTR|nr:hypothetical protein [Portunus trituberculatus]